MSCRRLPSYNNCHRKHRAPTDTASGARCFALIRSASAGRLRQAGYTCTLSGMSGLRDDDRRQAKKAPKPKRKAHLTGIKPPLDPTDSHNDWTRKAELVTKRSVRAGQRALCRAQHVVQPLVEGVPWRSSQVLRREQWSPCCSPSCLSIDMPPRLRWTPCLHRRARLRWWRHFFNRLLGRSCRGESGDREALSGDFLARPAVGVVLPA